MTDIIYTIVITAVIILAGYFVPLLFVASLKKVSGETKLKTVELLSKTKKPLQFCMPAIFLRIAIHWLTFSPSISGYIGKFLWIWIVLAVYWFSVKVIIFSGDLLAKKFNVSEKDNLRARQVSTQIQVIQRIIYVLLFIIVVAVILLSFNQVRQFGISLIASAGIAGIIIGFAAQKSLATLFAGIQIAISQPIRIDDVVIVENEWGWIEEITLTFVVVKIWDQRRLVVPITYFIEKPFQNWTRKTADILGSVFLYVDYETPVEKVRQELYKILEGSTFWDGKVSGLQVTNANEKTIELRALMSAEDSPTAWNLRCEVREKLIDFFQREFPDNLPKARIEMENEIANKNE